MTHLTPDEFVDAAEGTLDSARQPHLDACDTCRREVRALAALLREAAEVDVPEPSPLFWDQFSRRVRQAVSDDTAPAEGWSRWFRWPVLGPVGALTVLLVAALSTLPRTPAATPSPAPDPVAVAPTGAVDALPAFDEWSTVADIVGPLDWETASAAGLTVSPGDVEAAVLYLSDEERRELARLLAHELALTKS